VFERFTERARRVVVLAQEESRMLDHNYIGTEHLLLGLLHEGEGVAVKALESLGLSLEAVRQQVESTIGRGQTPPPGHIPFTKRAKLAMELSLREALALGHNYIGTEHILMGVLREGTGVATQVLTTMGADLEKVREQVVQLLSGYSESGQAETVAAGEIQSAATKGPSCPKCRKPLAETAVSRVLDVPDTELEGQKYAVTIVFCRQCGTSLGTLA
jgi:ATP-dependent Clp protease ATP-binding subunit ClpC